MNLQIFYDDIFPYAGDRPSRDKLDALAAGAVPCCGAVRCRLEDHCGPAEHRLQTELGGLRHGNFLREEMPVIGEGGISRCLRADAEISVRDPKKRSTDSGLTTA